MNDIKRPKQKAKRQIRRSNIALDEYLFDRKMQSLYYGKKPKSDDTPQLLKLVKAAVTRVKKEIRRLPQTLRHLPGALKKSAAEKPAHYLIGTLIIFVLAVFVAPKLISHRSKTPAAQPIGAGGGQGTSTSTVPTNQTPEFPVVLPEGKTQKDVGGFAKVSPPNAPAAYTYKDKINGIDILVTEQLLPESYTSEIGKKVEELALSFNATQSVQTEKSEFFIGTNATSGEQSVITYTKTLLILIKSNNKITNERWQDYIENLK